MRRYGLFLLLLLAISVWGVRGQQIDNFRTFLLETRADLELLGNGVLGEGVRPQTWTFNFDANAQSFIADLWFDNEQLADTIFGVGQRPPDWIGATSSNAVIVARNLRHDVERAADTFYAQRGLTRPPEWRGANAIFRCTRTIQNIVMLLDNLYAVRPKTTAAVANFCASIAAEIDDELIPIVFRNTELESQLPDLILAVRGDLERLADEKKGLNNRPPGWIRNVDKTSPTIISDNFLDLENLANDLLGNDQRPPGWIGAVSNSQAIAFRNLRHDLELLADATLGRSTRPRGWQGENPLQQCEPNIQNLVFIVTQNYGFSIDESLIGTANFCGVVEFNANNLAENPPIEEIQAAVEQRYMAEAQYAFAYLDVAALQYMGQVPPGTRFRAWYRNYSGSTMMFVSGDDFAVYIDRRWTTLSEDVFNTLPVPDGIKPLTFCDAAWCNGPGPTPTPTGSGPLVAIVQGATPPATISASEIGGLGKTQVSWNHVRVIYLLDKADTNTVQVSLEICAEPAQITCEPVIRVFDNNTGTNKQVLSQLNGLNVYEFPYGYSANLIIEGATRFSPDVWISDPTIR